jgi:hypothetical protein
VLGTPVCLVSELINSDPVPKNLWTFGFTETRISKLVLLIRLLVSPPFQLDIAILRESEE